MKLVLALILTTVVAQAETSARNPSAESSEATAALVETPTLPAVADPAELAVPDAVTEGGPAVKSAQLSENQIPVQLDNEKKASNKESPWIKILAGLLTTALIALGGVYFLRRYMRNSGEMKNAPQIKVLTQHYLGPKKHLAIVRVAGESILIGITDQNISMLKSLSLLDEEIPEATPKSFAKVFHQTNEVGAGIVGVDNNEDDFSISGIKDFVSSRLKGMRNLE